MNWPQAAIPLGSVLTVRYGKASAASDRDEDGPYPVVGSAGEMARTHRPLALNPAIVIGRKGNVGQSHYFDGGCWPTDTTFYVEPGPNIDPRFLLLQLEHLNLKSLDRSTATPSLRREDLEAQPVVLPLVPDQRRIVAILEEHLSDIDSAVRGVEACQGRLDALRSKTLQWAIDQAREDDECSVLTIGDLADVGTGTTPLRSKKDYYDAGTIPWITSGDLSGGLVIEPKQYVTALALHETSLRVYPPGTLLVAMYGEGKTRGSVAELGIAAAINQACAAIQLRNPEMLGWVRLVLAANYSAMRALASGGVQPNLNLSLVRGIPVPVASEPTRRRLLDIQLALDDAAQRLRLELRGVVSRGRSLRRALLAAAFSGRLTGRGSDTNVIEKLAEEESA